MNAIRAWLKSRNITSHTIAALILAALGLFASDLEFRDFIIKLLVGHPTILAAITAAAGIYFKYSGAHSPTGVLAEAPIAVAQIQAAAIAKEVAKDNSTGR